MGTSSLVTKEGRYFNQNIKVRRFDDIYVRIGITGNSFLKIDVEGYEFNVLLGAEKFIDLNRPKILLEYSPCFYNVTDPTIGSKIYDFFTSKNYLVFDISEGEKYDRIDNFDKLPNAGQTNTYCIPN